MSAYRFLAALTSAALVVAACSDDDPENTVTGTGTSPAGPSPSNQPTTPTAEATTPEMTPSAPGTPMPGPVEPTNVEEIVTDIDDAPWSITFIPGGDGDALVSLRDAGTIVRVTDSGDVTEVGEVPGVEGQVEGGLLGMAFHPEEPDTLYVYATMGGENQVVRTTYTTDGAGGAGGFGEFETVLGGIPAAARHDGGRLAFGPDGMLYVSTGETGEPALAQDLDSLGGKILRITPDGSVPSDNPFEGSPVYSYGHRNVEGLAFDDDGRLWASEFGDATADELNRIEAGGNYGWPEVEGIAGDDRFIDPVHEWPVEEASPSGLAYVAQTLFMAALRGERLWRIPLPGGEAGEPTEHVTGYGRLRDAAVAPDGTLWVLTNNTDGRVEPNPGDDRILRLPLAAS